MLMVGPGSMGGCLMRGRRPEKLTIARRHADVLHAAAHSGSLPWFQVQRAKIVLAIAAGERQCSVAGRLEDKFDVVFDDLSSFGLVDGERNVDGGGEVRSGKAISCGTHKLTSTN